MQRMSAHSYFRVIQKLDQLWNHEVDRPSIDFTIQFSRGVFTQLRNGGKTAINCTQVTRVQKLAQALSARANDDEKMEITGENLRQIQFIPEPAPGFALLAN